MNQAEIFLPGFAKFLRGGLRASLLKLLEASIRTIRIAQQRSGKNIKRQISTELSYFVQQEKIKKNPERTKNSRIQLRTSNR